MTLQAQRNNIHALPWLGLATLALVLGLPQVSSACERHLDGHNQSTGTSQKASEAP